jgi:hypothetical protein
MLTVDDFFSRTIKKFSSTVKNGAAAPLGQGVMGKYSPSMKFFHGTMDHGPSTMNIDPPTPMTHDHLGRSSSSMVDGSWTMKKI